MKTKLLFIKIFLVISIIMLIPFFKIYARDYLVEDNGEIEIIISKNNINRLKIFRDRIKDIRANPDELIIETDRVDGEIFIKPVLGKDSIDIFLKTENGFSYKLILKVEDIKAQQIFINRNNFTLQNYADSDILRREKLRLIDENLFFDFNDNYKLSAINLIRAMSSRAKLKEFSVINRESKRILNYKDYRVEWLFSYIKNDKSMISGEIVRIVNISDKRLDLTEDMFFKNGIRAVRIEKLELQPNEFSFLYFVGGGL